jgi:NADH-quinone oxidoreductase subunit I
MPRVIEHPERTFWVQAYLFEAVRGLWTTFRHFLRGLLRYEQLPTVPYPEIKPEIPPGYRASHRMMTRSDGTPRCVACFMCASACPAGCIRIEAEEDTDGRIEKRPKVFEIDHSVCVFCGLCVEACPADALRMDTGVTSFVHDKREKFLVTLDDLMRQPGQASKDYQVPAYTDAP